jgi:peptidylprolyl isomerase
MKQKLYKNKLLIVGLAFTISIAAIVSYQVINGNIWGSKGKGGIVLFVTSMGNITIHLWNDMPITTGNFKNLIRRGIYDNTKFHRVVFNFAIQGGDPTGTGYGDPSIPTIQDEYSRNSSQDRNLRGRIAMANANDPDNGIYNTGSSQFFFNLVDNEFLNGKHPVFGEVINGTAVMDEIGNVETAVNPNTGEKSVPVTPVYLIKALILSEG